MKQSTGTAKVPLASGLGRFPQKVSNAAAVIFLAGMLSVTAQAETIFTETFDNMPDQDINGDCLWEGFPGNCGIVPPNWDFTYSRDQNPANPAAEIIGGVGKEEKGFRVYDESYGTARQWGHDVQVAKHFAPNQYQELWISLWIRFNPDLNTEGLGSAKIFRMGQPCRQLTKRSGALSVRTL